MRDEKKCTLVMYHYVRDMHDTPYPDIKGLLIDKFKGQLNYISKNYKVISLRDYAQYLVGKTDIPRDACVLTFDDGLKDHFTNVVPLLKDMGVTATFFPTTQCIDEHKVQPVQKVHFLLDRIGAEGLARELNDAMMRMFPGIADNYVIDGKEKKEIKYRWDDSLTANLKYTVARIPTKEKSQVLSAIFSEHFRDEQAFCKELYLDWEDMRAMIKAGMDFGSHSHTHPALAELSEKEQEKEISISKALLEKNLKIPIELFCYPYGNFNSSTLIVLKKLGFKAAVTTDLGVNAGKVEPFRIRRLDTNDLPFE